MGGQRISELCETWRGHLNLGARVLQVGRSKTAAGYREIDLIFTALIDTLSDHLARHRGRADDYLFASNRGRRLSDDNLRRMLRDTVAEANKLCEKRELAPIMDGTPHMLRRTNISLLLAAGGVIPPT